jgi:hypothetical protein
MYSCVCVCVCACVRVRVRVCWYRRGSWGLRCRPPWATSGFLATFSWVLITPSLIWATNRCLLWLSLALSRSLARAYTCSHTHTHTHTHILHIFTVFGRATHIYLRHRTHARKHTHVYTNVHTHTQYPLIDHLTPSILSSFPPPPSACVHQVGFAKAADSKKKKSKTVQIPVVEQLVA